MAHEPPPTSMEPLAPAYRLGLIPIAVFAIVSLLSVTVLLVFITQRLIRWRRFYKTYVGYNQYIILIYNLLLADLAQAVAFAMSFHWLRLDAIAPRTMPCFVQAFALHLGDVASGFFVLAIALHTWLGVVRGYKMSYPAFIASILAIWAFALLLTVIGPALFHGDFFARAGGWCWVSTAFQTERLALHYLWIFLVEVGTIALYMHLCCYIRTRLAGLANTTHLTRASKFMLLYPAAYVLLTLPIAVGRMAVMAGIHLPDEFFVAAGSLLASCGWIDALLYAITRRILVSNHLSGGGGGCCGGADGDPEADDASATRLAGMSRDCATESQEAIIKKGGDEFGGGV